MLENSAEDAELIQRLFQKEKLNCKFRLATNKDTYLLALDEFHPDIILSDHSLPGFNSEDAFKIARQRFPDIPFIMITGTIPEEYAVNMIKKGVDDYILKDSMARLPGAVITTIQRRKIEIEKSETEQRIAQSECNLKTIFENTSEGFLLLDKHAVVLAFNNKAKTYAFYSKLKEFQIGQSIFNFIEDSRKGFAQEIIAKVLNGESIHYDRSYEIGNGKTAWIDFSATPVIENSQAKGICITGRDVTEIKIIAQEREFERNNLKALINNTNDPMWSIDRSFKSITSNDAFNKMVKVFPGKIITRGSDLFSSVSNQQQLNRFRKYYERVFSGESFTVTEHADFPDDFCSEISFYPILSGEAITGAACFSHDITQRKKAEKEIADYKNALDQSSIVSITDQKGIIRYVNDNFCKTSGYLTGELIGQHHRIINSGYHSTSFMRYLWATIVDGKIWRGELCNQAKDGALYWVDATIIPFLNNRGNPAQYLAITNDITEKKSMEQEIIAQKVQEQKKIVRAIIKAQEKERNHLGQELHDNITQILVSAKLYLEVAGDKSEEIKELMKYPMDLIKNSIDEIRLLSSNLVTHLKILIWRN